MVKAAQKAGVTNSIIRANVDANGKVKLIGTISKNAINPIVEVNYRNNVQLDFKEHGRYARNVVQTLQNEYGIKKVNMVGHSWEIFRLCIICCKLRMILKCPN